MKRKYLAIMMGMVLSLTSMNVYAVSAAETDTTTESAEASTEETAEEELTEDASGADSELDELANAPEVIGQVTDVSEESMMISVGTLSGEETTEAAAEAEPAEASEELEEITISDIKVGDIVKILSDENGQVTSIIVLAEGELTDAQEEETAETTEETADETAEDGSVEETEETAETTEETAE